MLQQPSEYRVYMVDIVVIRGRVDQDVINVGNNVLVNQVLENIINERLEHCRGIG